MTHYAKVELKNGQVYSSQYDDIYYSSDDGPAESEYVFLAGNDLPKQWQRKTNFCITETGFGTGLNFLVTVKAWLDDPARSKTLDYFAIEAYPLRATQLGKIHAYWPEFKTHSIELIEQYPGLTSGCHSLFFEQGRVQLHLIFERLEIALKNYTLSPDCWYLDGFSPARNPSMWNKKVLKKIASLSAPGISLATFTAAGEVRRNLIAAGFEVRKRAGFGRKREMLCALKSSLEIRQNLFKDSPWFAPPHHTRPPRKIAIIGAGIAGAQTAWHLAQRGVNVVVIEQLDQVAPAASGNLAGILAPKLCASAGVEEAFYLAAFEYQLRQIQALNVQGHNIAFSQRGLLQLAYNHATQQRFEHLERRDDLPADLFKIINVKEAAKCLGENVEHACMLIQKAGSLSPASLCRALLSHPNIELRLSTAVVEISNKDGFPLLKLSKGEPLSVDALVLANGYQAAQFSENTPITPVRGQTSSAQIADHQSMAHALRHAGYMVGIPGNPQRVIFGASYIRGDNSVDLRTRETRQDFEILRSTLPKLASRLTDIRPSHAGIRATTTDRWPLVGPLADADFYQREYADLYQGKQYRPYPTATYQAGTYVLSGLGSRGLSSAAYCANLLSHIIMGQSPPAPEPILQALHPARFLIRRLRKG